MDAGTLLRTVLVMLSLFGLPLVALVWSWRSEETPAAGEDSSIGQSLGPGGARAPGAAYDPMSRWE
jgi:hypothetical protein